MAACPISCGIRVLSYVIFVLSVISTMTYASEITHAWDPNPDSDIPHHYHLYHDTASRVYDDHKRIDSGTSGTVANLESCREYFFAVTACDINGHESQYSKELSYTIPAGCNSDPVLITSSQESLDFLQNAYHNAAANDIIRLQSWECNDPLNFDQNKSVIIDGGYDCQFKEKTGQTTLKKLLSISSGTLIIDTLVLATETTASGIAVYQAEDSQAVDSQKRHSKGSAVGFGAVSSFASTDANPTSVPQAITIENKSKKFDRPYHQNGSEWSLFFDTRFNRTAVLGYLLHSDVHLNSLGKRVALTDKQDPSVFISELFRVLLSRLPDQGEWQAIYTGFDWHYKTDTQQIKKIINKTAPYISEVAEIKLEPVSALEFALKIYNALLHRGITTDEIRQNVEPYQGSDVYREIILNSIIYSDEFSNLLYSI
jgi:hypothetical protein